MKKPLIILIILFFSHDIFSQNEYEKAKEMSDSLILSLVGKDFYNNNIKFRFDKSKYSTIKPSMQKILGEKISWEKEKSYKLTKKLRKNARRFILYYDLKINLLDTLMPISIMIRDNEICDFGGTIKCEENNNCSISISKDSAISIASRQLLENEKIIFVNFIWVRKFLPVVTVEKDGTVHKWGPNFLAQNFDKILEEMHKDKYGYYVWHFCISDGTEKNINSKSVCNKQLMINAVNGNIIK